MNWNKAFCLVFISMIFLTAPTGFTGAVAGNPPITAAGLITKHATPWHSATHHEFLTKVKDGSLKKEAFSTWLAQDYHFAGALLDAQSLMLLNAPRNDQKLLIGGLAALDSELSWFEKNSNLHNINLLQPLLPTTRAYVDFLLALQNKPYVVQITCLWALEKAYYDAWSSALPGTPKYREFIERWSTNGFKGYVDSLERAVDSALEEASNEQRALTEVYFLWTARYEKEFWEMAFTGNSGPPQQ